MRKRTCRIAWARCGESLTRSWWSIPGAQIGRLRLPANSGPKFFTSTGSTISPPHATCRFRTPREIMRSGSMAMMSLDPVEREKLRELIERLKHGDDAAYVVRCACDPSPDGSGGDTVVDHIRLFPLRTNVRWTYRVHEQILPALRRANVPVRWTDLTVRHTGYVDQALRARKLERDMKILQAELAERPDDPFILFNLGAIAIERKDWPGALTHLQKSLAGSAPSDSITRKLYALIARAHQMMGNASVALGVCRDGLTFDPDDAELWFRKGVGAPACG